MTTICSFCGKKIDENDEKNKGKKYLLCKTNCGFVPRGANSFDKRKVIKFKKEVKMAENQEVKKQKKKDVVIELLKQNLSMEEICLKANVKKPYVYFIKKKLNN